MHLYVVGVRPLCMGAKVCRRVCGKEGAREPAAAVGAAMDSARLKTRWGRMRGLPADKHTQHMSTAWRDKIKQGSVQAGGRARTSSATRPVCMHACVHGCMGACVHV